MEFATFCKLVGLELEPFQRRIEKAAAGPEREFVGLLPRGNGKSTLLAAIAVDHLLSVEKAAVYVAASSREQARVIFEIAAAFVRTLDHPNLVVRHHELRYWEDPETAKVFSRHLRVLAADAPRLHGLTPSLAIIDELHAHADDSVYLAMKTAQLKRAGSKLIVISTAGAGADSPLGRLRSRALAQPHVTRKRALTDARGAQLRFLEWSLDEDGDIDDPREVKRANPASWISTDGLREQREAVPDLAYRRFHANQWTEREGHWLPPGAWQACVGKPELTPRRGRLDWCRCRRRAQRLSRPLDQRKAARRLLDLPRRPGRARLRRQGARARRPVQCARARLRPVALRPSCTGARARRHRRDAVPADRRPDDPRLRPPVPRDRRATSDAP
jgi:phage terminase large subunit-like protein